MQALLNWTIAHRKSLRGRIWPLYYANLAASRSRTLPDPLADVCTACTVCTVAVFLRRERHPDRAGLPARSRGLNVGPRPWVGAVVPTWRNLVLFHDDAINAAPVACSDVVLNAPAAPATRCVDWSAAKRATVIPSSHQRIVLNSFSHPPPFSTS